MLVSQMFRVIVLVEPIIVKMVFWAWDGGLFWVERQGFTVDGGYASKLARLTGERLGPLKWKVLMNCHY